MKISRAFILLAMTSVFFVPDLYADWQSDWEKVSAAAKQEGQLNLYVGRYGQAALVT